MGQAVKLADTAKYHAARVGNGGISGDDPNKVIKLRCKMAQAQHLQERMKAANKVAKSKRKNYTDEEKIADLQEMGFSHADAVALLTPKYGRFYGFESYQLSNNSAEIRRIADRIAEEEANQAAANTPDATYTMPNGDDVTIVFDADDNRIRLYFPGKPNESVRSIVKRNGFNWSPYNKEWQRKMTVNARRSVQYLVKELGMIEA